jgi:hypothetical protein
MAVGDVVSDMGGIETISFQPAVGVEICITSLCSWSAYFTMFDGTTNANIPNNTNNIQLVNTKIMINNTNYLRTVSVNFWYYTGIQLK